jgi:hypothetical protein
MVEKKISELGKTVPQKFKLKINNNEKIVTSLTDSTLCNGKNFLSEIHCVLLQ